MSKYINSAIEHLKGKVILLTGGTGSLGQAFTKDILAKTKIKTLRIFSRDELKQYEMQKKFHDPRMRYFVGDVRDKERLARAVRGVDIVINAAAMKQIPACEYNPFEAIKVNILGAANLIETAIDHGVKQVIGISTDKAAYPVNLYGATKLAAEKLFIQGNTYAGQTGDTSFSCVRYGNVLASRGSVVPLFQEQKVSGTITITDPRMTRFWITLEQAVEFIIQSLFLMKRGEVFIPKLPSIRVTDLAKVVAPKAKINFIGRRHGEKLHEVLITEEEAYATYEYKSFFLVEPHFQLWHIDRPGGGKKLPDNFIYSSDKNDSWLTKEDLKKLCRL